MSSSPCSIHPIRSKLRRALIKSLALVPLLLPFQAKAADPSEEDAAKARGIFATHLSELYSKTENYPPYKMREAQAVVAKGIFDFAVAWEKAHHELLFRNDGVPESLRVRLGILKQDPEQVARKRLAQKKENDAPDFIAVVRKQFENNFSLGGTMIPLAIKNDETFSVGAVDEIGSHTIQLVYRFSGQFSLDKEQYDFRVAIVARMNAQAPDQKKSYGTSQSAVWVELSKANVGLVLSTADLGVLTGDAILADPVKITTRGPWFPMKLDVGSLDPLKNTAYKTRIVNSSEISDNSAVVKSYFEKVECALPSGKEYYGKLRATIGNSWRNDLSLLKDEDKPLTQNLYKLSIKEGTSSAAVTKPADIELYEQSSYKPDSVFLYVGRVK